MNPLPPVLVLDLFPEERAQLLALLSELSDRQWDQPTVCPGWSVKDIAAHILGDDIGRLSRQRDAFAGAAFVPQGDEPFEAQLLAFINRKNQPWVEAARRLSRRLLCDLLRFTGEETQRHFHSLDLFALGEPVSWAGPEPAPVWLDMAREYTERWLHHQQVRDALGRPGLTDPRFFAPVLATFVRALPHTFRDVQSPEGVRVDLIISGEAGGDWSLVRQGGRWLLTRGASGRPASTVVIDQDAAWRLFTKGIARDEAVARATLTGDRRLALKALDTVSIIA